MQQTLRYGMSFCPEAPHDTEGTMVSNRHNGRARRGRPPCRRHTQFEGLCYSAVNDRNPPIADFGFEGGNRGLDPGLSPPDPVGSPQGEHGIALSAETEHSDGSRSCLPGIHVRDTHDPDIGSGNPQETLPSGGLSENPSLFAGTMPKSIRDGDAIGSNRPRSTFISSC
jgi:hypothetical protein